MEKLSKVLKDTNKELKTKSIFKDYQIMIDGDFTTKYNDINLYKKHHHFPIAWVENEREAIIAIKAYLTGLKHGEDKSYVKFCDKNDC
jgi:hypothetical protein